jgi:hypothetical protein
MEVVALAILISVFVVGFLIAGRWVQSVFAQLLLGVAVGIAIIGILACAAAGVAFAGCLLMAGGKMDFK